MSCNSSPFMCWCSQMLRYGCTCLEIGVRERACLRIFPSGQRCRIQSRRYKIYTTNVLVDVMARIYTFAGTTVDESIQGTALCCQFHGGCFILKLATLARKVADVFFSLLATEIFPCIWFQADTKILGTCGSSPLILWKILAPFVVLSNSVRFD